MDQAPVAQRSGDAGRAPVTKPEYAGSSPAGRIDATNVLRVYLVFNGELGMSTGKLAAQAFQACERIFEEMHAEGLEAVRERVYEWKRHTTTITRIARNTHVFERVCAECEGVVMVD